MMKKHFLVFLFLISCFFSNTIKGQDITYLDSNWKKTVKQNAKYYRKVLEIKKGKEIITDYFISGKKAKEVIYFKGIPNGKYSEYYETGSLKITGKLEDGEKVGIWKTYYKNGKIKEKGKYKKGEKVGVWKRFYKNDK